MIEEQVHDRRSRGERAAVARRVPDDNPRVLRKLAECADWFADLPAELAGCIELAGVVLCVLRVKRGDERPTFFAQLSWGTSALALDR
jgi:hypothetical protein